MGNEDCARLCREFTETKEDDRNVDELVEFITGKDKEKKKRRINKKNAVKSEKTDCSVDNKKKTSHNETMKTCTKDDTENDRVTNLQEAKVKLEQKIAEKHVYFDD